MYLRSSWEWIVCRSVLRCSDVYLRAKQILGGKQIFRIDSMKQIMAVFGRRAVLVLISGIGCVVVWMALQAHADSQGFAAMFCGRLGGGCDRAFNHSWSVFPPGSDPKAMEFSLPMTVVGMWHFGFLFIWFVVVGIPSVSRRWWHLVPLVEISLAAVAAAMFVVVMITQQIGCLYCIASHLLTFLLAIGIYRAWPGKQKNAQSAKARPRNRLAVITLCIGFVLAIGLSRWANPHLNQSKYQRQISQFILEHFEQSPIELKIGDGDAIQPSNDGQNTDTLVLFFDVQCQPCKQFMNILEETIQPLFGGRLTVVYKHFPLASQCNPSVPDMHPYACEAAKLVEAARRQGGMDAFLKMADLAFDHRLAFSPTANRAFAYKAGLDADQLERDFNDAELADMIQSHVQQGMKLGLDGTPCVFLNGLRVDKKLIGAEEFWTAAADGNQENSTDEMSF